MIASVERPKVYSPRLPGISISVQTGSSRELMAWIIASATRYASAATPTGERLLTLNRPQDALILARLAIDDVNRVDKALWAKNVLTAMLPVTSVQETTVPHMNPLKKAPIYNTVVWAIQLHKLAGNALRATGQSSQASQEYAAANELQQSLDNAQRNAPPPLRRR